MNANAEKLEALFGEALRLKPEERTAFLARECGGDLELRQRLEDLLRADAGEIPCPRPTRPSEDSKLTRDEADLLDAAAKGNVSEVERLLTKGVDSNVKDDRWIPWDITPLMHASRWGHVEVVRALLAAGASLKARDKHVPGEPAGKTALHYAAGKRHIAVAKLLVEAGADVNAVGTAGTGTALMEALEGDPEGEPSDPPASSLQEMLEADGKKKAIAAQDKSIIEFVRFMLSVGADPNRLARDRRGAMLHFAAWDGLIEIVQVLLDAGADVNLQDATGSTALNQAVFAGKKEVAMLLLERGADVNLKEDSGWTSLHWAVKSNDPKLINTVVKRGAKLNAKTDDGLTPLGIAIRDKHEKAEKLLRQLEARTENDA